MATFTDDHSRKLWVYFLKTKDRTFQTFLDFRAATEHSTGRLLVATRCDNGGEYSNNAWKVYSLANGIQHQFTVPHLPQQNGRAERVNCTIADGIHTLLIESVSV